MTPAELLLVGAGAIVVSVAMLDVFLTVLYPASGHGPIRNMLSRLVWRGFRLAGRLTSGRSRRAVLSYSGPTVIAATLLAWLVMLVVGWAMIHWPALGNGIEASSGATERSWSAALYFSGFNLTTLGVGDLVPVSATYRLLTVIEAATGFMFFSMVITYFLSVYSNLPVRNAFAMALDQLTGSTGDAAEMLSRIADGDDLSEARTHLSSTADFMRATFQAHRFYPVLRYFHYREPCYALPRILLVSLDAVTLLHTAVDRVHYRRLLDSPALNGLGESARAMMQELVPEADRAAPTRHQHARWKLRYAAAIARLKRAGVAINPDPESGAEAYVAMRATWDEPIRQLSESMLCQWDEVEKVRVGNN